MESKLIETADNRLLEVLATGEKHSSAVVFHHGTPGHAVFWERIFETWNFKQVMGIAMSRPGYGQSTRNIGRSVASQILDTAAVLDSLEIDNFVSVGWSGGGPHALADNFDSRSRGSLLLAGAAPYKIEGFNFMDGMGPENVEEFESALQGIEVIERWLSENASTLPKVGPETIAKDLGGLVSKPDVEALNGGLALVIARSFNLGLHNDFSGWIDDDLAFTRDWGFDLDELDKPVLIVQGDMDFMVPQTHAQVLKGLLKRGTYISRENQGHISILKNFSVELGSLVNLLEQK